MKMFFKILFNRGPIFFWQYFVNNIMFDVIRGTDTYRRKLPSEYHQFLKDLEYGIYYVGVKTSTLRNILNYMNDIIDKHLEEYQFVDLGSGKGKSLIYYLESTNSKNKFKPIGLEYDAELYNIAKSNFEKLNFFSRVKLFNKDARDVFTCTDSKKLIIYMYNPFSWDIMANIIKGVSNNYIDCYIIYIDPVEGHNIEKNNFNLVYSLKGRFPADSINVYRLVKKEFTSIDSCNRK